MKIIFFIILFFIPLVSYSQTTFFGYEIIFDEPNPKFEYMTPDSTRYFSEDHYYFERITQYYDNKMYMFSNSNPTGMVFKRVYEELINTFGIEDINKDYIPPKYQGELTYEELVEFCLSRKAEIYRAWKSHPEFTVALAVIKDGLSVKFEKK